MELVQEHFVNSEQAKLQPYSPMLQFAVKGPVLKMEMLELILKDKDRHHSDTFCYIRVSKEKHIAMLTLGTVMCGIVLDGSVFYFAGKAQKKG